MMKYNLDDLRDFAPFYIQGTLSEEEEQGFREGLERYPELRGDLAAYSEIGDFYKEIEGKITPPTQRVFTAIQQNINQDDTHPVVQSTTGSRIEQAKEWMSELFTVPKIGWGIAAVQCVLIVFLLLPNQREARYETLSSSKPSVVQQITLQLVFDEKTTEKEMRQILNTINGEITGGPSAEGMYQVGLHQNSDVDSIITELREKKTILFVERAF